MLSDFQEKRNLQVHLVAKLKFTVFSLRHFCQRSRVTKDDYGRQQDGVSRVLLSEMYRRLMCVCVTVYQHNYGNLVCFYFFLWVYFS